MYTPDHTGVIHSYMMNDKNINNFRMSVTLREKVDTKILQRAADEVLPEFPLIGARLTPSRLFYRIKPVKKGLKIHADRYELLKSVTFRNISQYAIQVLFRDNQIAVEFFHGLTDAVGAFTFMKALINRYLHYRYPSEVQRNDIVLNRKNIWQDCYPKHGIFHYGVFNVKLGQYYHFPYRYVRVGNRTVTYSMSVKKIKNVTRQYRCSVTELLTGILFLAVYHMRLEKQNDKRKIAMMVAVNLRSIFSEKTLRNFSLYVTPVIKNFGNGCLEDILPELQKQIKWQKSRKYLENQIYRNEKLQNNILFAKLPLRFKRTLVQSAYKVTGGKTCMTLSNFGVATFPEDMTSYIDEVDFLLSTRYQTQYNCAVISYRDTLRLSLTNNGNTTVLEKKLEEMLLQLGIPFEQVEYG